LAAVAFSIRGISDRCRFTATAGCPSKEGGCTAEKESRYRTKTKV
jgi:hypothetical protein